MKNVKKVYARKSQIKNYIKYHKPKQIDAYFSETCSYVINPKEHVVVHNYKCYMS